MKDLEFVFVDPPVESDIDPLYKLWVAKTPYGDYMIENLCEYAYDTTDPIRGKCCVINGTPESTMESLNKLHHKILLAAKLLNQ